MTHKPLYTFIPPPFGLFIGAISGTYMLAVLGLVLGTASAILLYASWRCAKAVDEIERKESGE